MVRLIVNGMVSFVRGGCYFWAVVVASMVGLIFYCIRLERISDRLFDLAIKWENEL